MAKHFSLSARNLELRLANTGVTIHMEDTTDQNLSGKLRVTKTGLTWTPKRKWEVGPRSIRITWDDVPDVFARYQEAP